MKTIIPIMSGTSTVEIANAFVLTVSTYSRRMIAISLSTRHLAARAGVARLHRRLRLLCFLGLLGLLGLIDPLDEYLVQGRLDDFEPPQPDPARGLDQQILRVGAVRQTHLDVGVVVVHRPHHR